MVRGKVTAKMTFIADLHIHSHFSRATSRDLVPESLALWAQKKGITLVGTGDFTHPGWISELREKTVGAENGLYRLKPELERQIEGEVPPSCRAPTRFLLSGEISCIYKRGGKTRKVHHLVLMPDFDAVLRLNARLSRIGNITSDGRPILGLDSRDLLEIVLEASDKAFFIPAHIWTPWFSLFGSKSGFDALEECFGDLTSHIHALETGLSSDPPMNRRVSALDGFLLVSNSDAHSPAKLGREANIFDAPLDYEAIQAAMIRKHGFGGTIEFFPEEGKYHLDGHRKCRLRLRPDETRLHQGICPTCGSPLTVGVLNRVDELADREAPKITTDFFSLIPLTEILSEIYEVGPSAKKVLSIYEELLALLGPETRILMESPLEDIEAAGGPLLAEGIKRMRGNQVICEEGYDGEYGVIRLFHPEEKHALAGQFDLFKAGRRESAGEKRPLHTNCPSRSATPIKADQEEPGISDPILDPLNSAQRQAVLHEGSHLLIVAGPGTGKTMTLSHRVAYLIQVNQATPDQVLAVTFTNKAAREMGERIRRLCRGRGDAEEGRACPARDAGGGGVRVATFHAFCIEVLRSHGEKVGIPPDFILCSELDSLALAQQVVSESGGKKRAGLAFLRKIPHLKTASVMGDLSGPAHDETLPYFQKYQQRLRSLGMLDMDDLEVETLRLFQRYPGVSRTYGERFPWIFVDEYQDTNPIQVCILKALTGVNSDSPCTLHPAPCTIRICAIGDPDQAIYGFRGAKVESFLAFSSDFPGASTIMLTRNYRSTQVILDGASALMRKETPLEGHMGMGDPMRITHCRTHSEEAEMVVEQIEKLLGGTSYFSIDSGRVSSTDEGEHLGFGDIAVLFRLNAQGGAFEEAFSRAGIPFVRSGEKPLTSRYPVDIIWRFLQAMAYLDNTYYREAYLSLCNEHSLSSPWTGEDEGGGAQKGPLQIKDDGSAAALIDQAATLHQLEGPSLSEEALLALRRLKEFAQDFEGDVSSFLDHLSLDRGIDHAALTGDRVALMSLHAAKGLEWPVVFITGCEDRLLPCTLFGNRDDDEERRLFYVGMTRARRQLILSHVKRRTINNRMLEMDASPFLSLISQDLLAPLERTKWKRRAKTHKQLDLFE